MTEPFNLFHFFSLLCGLAIFLYGMQQGEKNLKMIGGKDLRRVISAITRHRISAYIAGFVTTLLTQSSSATTVMLVGLASAQLMTLSQSLGMILGSGLGTTLTVQLFAFKFYYIAPFLIATGYFASLSRKSDRLSGYGKLVLAMGFIFFGMQMMAEAVTPLRNLPLFERMLYSSLTNPWYGLLAGTLITAVIQSSAATLAIVIALGELYNAGNGFIPGLREFLPLVLGANLGTCITAFLSALRADLEGTRVAWAHFIFKLTGTAVVFPFTGLLVHLDSFAGSSAAVQIAFLHTSFNIFISILFLPFLNTFEKAILKLVNPGRKSPTRYSVSFLHENVIGLPVLALSQAVKEIARMSESVSSMVEESRELINCFDLRRKNRIVMSDDEVDFLHESIVAFLTRMGREELDPEQSTRAYQFVMITTDLEHVGDIISKSIVNLAEKIEMSPLPLSKEGRQEILEFYGSTSSAFQEALAAFVMNDLELARKVFSQKKKTDELFDQLLERHMNRLYKKKPESLQTTSIHVDLLEEIRRINHFTFRIAAHTLRIHHAG
ncbi:MAG: Na/Pi cotransporter family protein [Fibrobacter sp.]|nr:Na/Pi cotransporter family protein [Fibrobacter sp.]